MLQTGLLILHFIGLMMGAGGGFGSMIVMRRANALAPEQAGQLRALGPGLARFSAIGLVLLWLTGLGMVFLNGGFAALPSFFWMKMIFVTTLTIAAIATEVSYAQLKKGDLSAAKRLPVLGPIAGMSSLLAVACAAIAFH